MIAAFLKRFGDISIEHVEKVGKKYYQQPPKLKATVDALTDYPTSAGLFLGENQKNQFLPSPNLLNIIDMRTNRKIILNEKSAWLFVCGRDVFIENVLQNHFGKGFVLVLNEKHEILGIAEKEGKTYKNMYDIGILLRREQGKKKFK